MKSPPGLFSSMVGRVGAGAQCKVGSPCEGRTFGAGYQSCPKPLHEPPPPGGGRSGGVLGDRGFHDQHGSLVVPKGRLVAACDDGADGVLDIDLRAIERALAVADDVDDENAAVV